MAHLHGYQVERMSSTLKRHGFLLKPPEPQMRTFSFCAENETDQKRYIDLFFTVEHPLCELFIVYDDDRINAYYGGVGLITMLIHVLI